VLNEIGRARQLQPVEKICYGRFGRVTAACSSRNFYTSHRWIFARRTRNLLRLEIIEGVRQIAACAASGKIPDEIRDSYRQPVIRENFIEEDREEEDWVGTAARRRLFLLRPVGSLRPLRSERRGSFFQSGQGLRRGPPGMLRVLAAKPSIAIEPTRGCFRKNEPRRGIAMADYDRAMPSER